MAEASNRLRSKVYVALLPLVVLTGCQAPVDEGFVCTPSVDPSIVVFVVNDSDGTPEAEGAWGWIQDGEYVEDFHNHRWSPDGVLLSFQAGYERTGIFDVFVRKDGFADWERLDVRVDKGACCQRRLKMSQMWRLKMSHFGGR